MNVIELLKRDHQKVNKLLEHLLDSSNNDTEQREKDFTNLIYELAKHTRFEESSFYPLLKNKSETKDLIRESYAEHNMVEKIIDEMQDLAFDDEKWGAKLVLLQESIAHHVKEEEQELFPKAKKILDSNQLEELGKQLIEFKTSLAEVSV